MNRHVVVRAPLSQVRRRNRIRSGLLLSSAFALATGCVGVVGSGDDETGGFEEPSTHDEAGAITSSALRRLSARELANTYADVAGFVPEAIDRLPPDSLTHSFDRVVDAQTFSPAHLDAYTAMANEAARTLIGERSLAERVDACSDETLAGLVVSTETTVEGAALGLYPEWSVAPSPPTGTGQTQYAPEVQAVHTHTFADQGLHRLSFELAPSGPVHATVSVDGVVVDDAALGAGAQVLEVEADIISTGAHVLEIAIASESNDGGLSVVFQTLRIEGPLSDVAAADAEAVRSCALGVIDEVVPRAYRRPLATSERTRLVELYDEVVDGVGEVEALEVLLSSVFSSPHFLFLVEVGEPVQGREGAFALSPHELAARLSYAVCERPPDGALWAAAAGDELVTAAQIEAQARRLLGEPCAEATVSRFFEHWLWLNRLPELAKSPVAFPEFDDGMRDGLVTDARTFLREMVFSQEQPIGGLFDSDQAWPGPETGQLYGVEDADGGAVSLPAERRGILTSPSVLAVTGTFDGTSPVTRGVYVLEQILCTDMPPPPEEVDIIVPVPDPSLTTRDRWAAHTEDPACAGCHQAIDPIGFALEDFDGIGRYRTEENGLPVDASGGVPAIGVDHVVGGAELSEAIAASSRLSECVATQWLRFVLGRLEMKADGETLENVTAMFDTGSVREALVSIVTSDAFIHRYEGDSEQ